MRLINTLSAMKAGFVGVSLPIMTIIGSVEVLLLI
jgi:hypothetical protein